MKTYLLSSVSLLLVWGCSQSGSDPSQSNLQSTNQTSVSSSSSNGSGYADLDGDIINYVYNDFGGFQLRFSENKLNWHGMGGYFEGVAQQVVPTASKISEDVYFMSWPTPGQGSDNVVMNLKTMQVFAHLTDPSGKEISVIDGAIICRNGSECAAPPTELTPPPEIVQKITSNMTELDLPPMNDLALDSRPLNSADLEALEDLMGLQIDYLADASPVSLRVGNRESLIKTQNGDLTRVQSFSTKVGEDLYFISWFDAQGDNHILFDRAQSTATDLVSESGQRQETVTEISCFDRSERCAPLIPETPQQLPNFLVLIGDDMGKDTLNCYDVGENQAHTPNLDKLCQTGAVFDNYWTQPFCSPTRATLLTGEYSFSNGVVAPVMPNLTYETDHPERPADAPAEVRFMQPELIRDFVPAEVVDASRGLKKEQRTLLHTLKEFSPAYTTGAFGKWHLADPVNGAMSHPAETGFDEFEGYISGTLLSHFAWRQVDIEGKETPETGYITSRIVDDATGWIADQSEPWFAWVAFTTPKEPFHLPPKDLLSSERAQLDPDQIGPENLDPYFLAAVEGMDTEIGRLLSSIPEDELENTYVIFMSDNGSPAEIGPEPYSGDRVKGTVFQGGVDMPMMIHGPGIKSGRYTQLVNSTDLLSSVLEFAGAPEVFQKGRGFGAHSISFAKTVMGEEDSQSRSWIYADGRMGPTAATHSAIRDEQFKYMMIGEIEYLFDLVADPFETKNLLSETLSSEASASLMTLKQTLAEIGAPSAEFANRSIDTSGSDNVLSSNADGSESPINGQWKVRFSSPLGEQTAKLVLVERDGTVVGQFNQAETSGEFDGTNVSFTGPMATPMGEMVLGFEGTVSGNEMTGTFKRVGGITPPPGAPTGGAPWSAVRD